MGGGLLQLVAMGAQDAYLSGNPQITFWKGMFKRHTNFAMEPFRINFTGQPSWGTKQSATINRNADLLYSTYLEVHLPHYDSTRKKDACYNNDQFHLGYNLLKYAELEIGGQLIVATPLMSDSFYEDFDHIKPYSASSILSVFGGSNTQTSSKVSSWALLLR